MCGIAAVMSRTGPARPLGLEHLRHRGPDGSGEWTSPDGRIWLGHTRLAIVDLSPTGAQPMHDDATGNVIVFNGEIYNHMELRAEMRRAAVEWKGTSDTETLLAGYRLWGEDVVRRAKGMFAFVIYDAARNGIFVARGPLGIKPVYYEMSDGGVRFASEIRALVAGTKRECDEKGVSSFLQWGSCPETAFIFPQVRMLGAGHFMTVAADGTIGTERYWPANALPSIPASAAPARVRKLVEDAVASHLMADVPVASFLSGGIDSSIVTALASRAMGGQRLQTFSVGFPHAEFDETNVAAEVAAKYNTDHHRIEVSDDEAIVLVQEAVQTMDSPSVDAINTYIVSKKVAGHGIKVALSGLGADELFGGYPSFRDAPRLRVLAAIPQAIRRLGSRMGKLGARIADLPHGDLNAIAIWRRRLWSDEMLREAGLPLTPLWTETPPKLADGFARISWAELSVYMRQMLLRDSDQMSMAVSLELRVPFLDRDLVEYVLSLPAREKTRHPGIKGLLVEACRDLIPASVYDRPKMGFSLPMDAWMRGPLQHFKQAGLGEIERLELLTPGTIPRLTQQFRDGRLHWTRIWSLVVLGHYLKRMSVKIGYESAALAHV
jgi:asparagine synthase (glutamine-hydrolysing)